MRDDEGKKPLKPRFLFYGHILAYVLVCALLWVIFASVDPMRWTVLNSLPIDERLLTLLRIPWPLIVMVGWGASLLRHGLQYYARYGGGAIRREAAIEREVQSEIARLGIDEKPKNDSRLKLSDNMELAAVDDEPAWTMKRK